MASGSVDQQIQDLKTQLVGAFRTLGTFLADLKTQVGSVKETVEALQSRGVSSTSSGSQISREEYQQSIQLIAQHLRTLASEIGELKAQGGGSQNDDALAQTPADVERVVREALGRLGPELQAAALANGQLYEQLRDRLDRLETSLGDLPRQVWEAPRWAALDALPAIASGLDELSRAAREQLERPVADPAQIDALIMRVDELKVATLQSVGELREAYAESAREIQEGREAQTRQLEESLVAAQPPDLRAPLEALPERIVELLPTSNETPLWGERILEAVQAAQAEHSALAQRPTDPLEGEQLLERVDRCLTEAAHSWREELSRLQPATPVIAPEGTAGDGASLITPLLELGSRLDTITQQVGQLAASLDRRLATFSSEPLSPANSPAADGELAGIRQQLAEIEAAVRSRDVASSARQALGDELAEMEARLEAGLSGLREWIQAENERAAAVLEAMTPQLAPEPSAAEFTPALGGHLQSLEAGIQALSGRIDQLKPPDPSAAFASAADDLEQRLRENLEQRLGTLEESLRAAMPSPAGSSAHFQALEKRLETLEQRLAGIQSADPTEAIRALAASLDSRFARLEDAMKRPIVVPPSPARREHSVTVPAGASQAETPVEKSAPGTQPVVPPKPAPSPTAPSDGEDVNRLLLEALGLEQQ